ncbi:MAG: MqnA/MqnD/SBP family protein [Leptospirales bacterium]
MDISLAISSCPNDTFSFYHFIHDPQPGFNIKPVLLDIEELNQGMLRGAWDIVKASFPVAVKVRDKYNLMRSGSALGFGVGPILIYKNPDILKKKKWRVGLPGENTTAHFLWNYYTEHSGELQNIEFDKIQMHFALIMEKLESGEIDAGVVIHEGRFEFEAKGLKLFKDLGEFWEKTAKAPVPLGGIFISGKLPESVKNQLEEALEKSISQALEEKAKKDPVYETKILPFMKKYSQTLEKVSIERHIDYYVNRETECMSEWGHMAVDKLWAQLERNSKQGK